MHLNICSIVMLHIYLQRVKIYIRITRIQPYSPLQSRLIPLNPISKIVHCKRVQGKRKEGPRLGYLYTLVHSKFKKRKNIKIEFGQESRVLSEKLCYLTGYNQQQVGVRRVLKIRDREELMVACMFLSPPLSPSLPLPPHLSPSTPRPHSVLPGMPCEQYTFFRSFLMVNAEGHLS